MSVPRFGGTQFGLKVQASFERDIRMRYYGLGNDRLVDTTLAGPDYYLHVLERPRLIARLLRHVRGDLSASFVLGLETTQVSQRGERAFFIDQGAAVESGDRLSGFVGLAVQWDTRDDEIVPRLGGFHEWFYETSRGVVLQVLGRELDYSRFTLTDMRYLPLSRRLTVANRVVGEALFGDVPLYAFGEIGGTRRTRGLGGGHTLRGFERQRFTDKVRAFSNTELRCALRSIEAFEQYFEWHAAVFVDGGRVWPAVDELSLSGTHWTAGAGLRLFWDMDFVTRLDVGLSPEQEYVAFKFDNLF